MEWDPEGRLCVLTALIVWLTWLGVAGIAAVVLAACVADSPCVRAPDAEDAA